MQEYGLMSTAQAARLLFLDEESVRRAIRKKQLYAIKRGRRWFVPRLEIQRYQTLRPAHERCY
ncbi:MAG TPA: helix-turn-helix domain-containing protein [Nitrospiraceae bacterium]|jgi:excisionase family DNA binding protein|nr:helix-turn-helix domain-containing protein [Nitrospiraceae bacterium]